MASSTVTATLASIVLLLLCVGFGYSADEEIVEGHMVKLFTPLVGDPFNVTCPTKSKSAYWTNKRSFYRKGSLLAFSKITKNYSGLYYCYDYGFHLEEVVRIKVENGKRYNATEGQLFAVKCKTSSRFAFWTNKHGFYERGTSLSFFPVKRGNTGWYYCYRYHDDLVEKIYMDVLYPAKILHISRDDTPLNENETFSMTVTVEGHPDPTTSFIEQDGGKIISKKSGPGEFTIKTEPVHCADGGMYRLLTKNVVGNDTKNEELLIYCPPSPKGGLSKNFKPRLGQKVALQVENTGYPYPTYTWTFKGEVLANGTGQNKYEYDIEDVHIGDFGKYTLTMSNEFGEATLKYNVQADGPPDPVTSLLVSNITENSAVISFESGYDYDAYQTFIVESFNGETYEEAEIFADKARRHNPHLVTYELKHLDLGTTYNISILANNSRGEGEMSEAFVVFNTEAPYSLYEIEEGENLHLECNGTSMTDVHWEFSNGTTVSTTDELDIDNITRGDSGFYKCVGKTASDLVHILLDYQVDVDYPADILNISIEDNFFSVNETLVMEIQVEGHPTPETTFTKVRHGEVVFSAKQTGSFNITVDPIECTDLGKYILNVSNKIGSDTYEQEIFVYCPPVVDPQAVIKKQVYPRLGNAEALKIMNYGYPYPAYKWKHDDQTIDKHEDSDYESQVKLDVKIEDFGNYFVDMENEYGLADFEFEVIASGPPDPVTDFKLDNVTYDSVFLSWMSGYNYGSPQTFVVMVTRNVPNTLLMATETQNFTFTDKSQHGLERGSYEITGLDSATAYNFTVVSFNGNGTSVLPKSSVDTHTSDSPNPEPQTSDKTEKNAIIGGVLGAVCFVAILAVVAVFLKKRQARRATYTF